MTLPVSPDVQRDTIPPELRERPQWVCWRYERDGNGRPTKVPFAPSGRKASSTDRATWSSFDVAYGAYLDSPHNFSGVGYVFSGEPGDFVGVDLDHVRDPESGELRAWTPEQRRCPRWASDAPEPAEIISTLGTYAEISPSETGVKLIVRGNLSIGGKGGDFECYCKGRYFAITGLRLPESPASITSVNGELDQIVNKFLRVVRRSENPTPLLNEPDDSTPEQDAELIQAAVANDEKFARLWSGDTTGYASHSEADLALCSLLTPLCDGSAARVDRFFRRSGLMRPKWDERRGNSTYGGMTIARALTRQEAAESNQPAATSDDLPPDLWKPASRTDTANAVRMVAMFGIDVRYCPTWEKWLHWDGKRWAVDHVRYVEHAAKDIGKSLWPQVAEIAQREDVKAAFVAELSRFAKHTSSDKGIKAMLSLARSTPSIVVMPEHLDSHPLLLCCENGTLDLASGDLRPHRREDYLTKMAPVKFDPHAAAPTWERFLDEVFEGNRDLIEFIQRAAGYSLTGDTSERCLFFLHGRGRNGKTTLVSALQKLLGDLAVTVTSDLLSVTGTKAIPAEVVDLFGARMAVANETEDGSQLAESFIKAATGGEDRLKGRRPYEQFVEFSPSHKLWICGNHKPRVRGTDDGIWDRIRLVPFNVRFERPDKSLPKKLAAEREGIFRWCVEGAIEWKKHGLGEPQTVKQATVSYRSEEDIFARFVADCCTIAPDAEAYTSVLSLAFEAWCRRNGERFPGTRALGVRLTEIGVGTRRGAGGKTIRTGINVLTQHMSEEEHQQLLAHIACREGVPE